MRYVIFGAGAVGGTIGVRLHQSGHDVILIARGAHHRAIAERGLRLRTPDEDVTLRIPAAASASEAGLGSDDVVLLCVKSQDTREALRAIRDALPAAPGRAERRPTPPIVCVQNGVDNERAALRYFPVVYGAAVMLPAEHLEPGVVVSYGTNVDGRLDIGRYPRGSDALARQIAADLAASARFETAVQSDVMTFKYSKLVINLFNAIEAICGSSQPEDNRALRALALGEGERILDAAGIEHSIQDIRELERRWARFGVAPLQGRRRGGSSTWQSIARGTGRVETDALTGEIVLIARLQALAAPVNELLQDLVARTVHEQRTPGWISAREILDQLAPVEG